MLFIRKVHVLFKARLCKMRLIFPRINGPNNPFAFDSLPKHGMSFEASKASVLKLKYRKEINLK